MRSARSSLLLRDYLQRALYEQSSGYFAKEVVRAGQALPFGSFGGEKDYRMKLAAEYAQAERAWLTPVETFQPHYAHAIARSIHQTHSALYPGEPLQVLEVGGGNGTFAAGVMGWLRSEAPETFARSRYLLLEVSERLAEAQRQRLHAERLPAERWEVVHSCASMWAEELEAPLPGPWFIVALEVIDNLPHDKLRLAPDASTGVPTLYEAHVRLPEQAEGADGAGRDGWFPAGAAATGVSWLPSGGAGGGSDGDGGGGGGGGAGGGLGRCTEEWRPMADDDARDVAELLGLDSAEGILRLRRDMAAVGARASLGGGGGGGGEAGEGGAAAAVADLADSLQGWMSAAVGKPSDQAAPPVFLPTGAYRLLCRLLAACPEHQLILADFDYLPPQPDGAVGAPVVQTQRRGVTVDLGGDYLAHPGECDVLFPTHFRSLAQLCAALVPHRTPPAVVRTADFMRRHADLRATTCADGYNPLLEDFTNTSMLVSSWDAAK